MEAVVAMETLNARASVTGVLPLLPTALIVVGKLVRHGKLLEEERIRLKRIASRTA